MKITDVITEAASPAQQAAKAGKKPKQGVAEGSASQVKRYSGKPEGYTFSRVQQKNYDMLVDILARNGMKFTKVDAQTYPGQRSYIDRLSKSTPIMLTTFIVKSPALEWHKYEGLTAGGGQNTVKVGVKKMKLTDFLRLDPKQQDALLKSGTGVAEGSSESVSLRDMVNVVDRHYPKYYAELSGSDISDKQFERAIVNAYKKIMQKQGVAEGLVGDVVVHNYTKIPIDLEPGQAQIAGWGPNDEPLYRVKGQDGKEVKTWSKRRMLTIAKEQGVAEDTELAEEFDLIESIVEMIAEHNGVDADVVWADLESLTEDELYVFAVTSDPLMEDWQKANKRDRTDGMSQKAVNAYRRENPGSKLKTAVTTKPSKLKKGGKASKRRKSYCSRSRGQMKMHSISCAKTPDKAICKARRRWNC